MPWRAIELGRGGYTVAQVKANLTLNTDGGTYNASLIDQALTECNKSNGSVYVHLWACDKPLGSEQPTHILLNLGVNDVGFAPPWTLPNQTTWQNDYISILDTLHAQWPNARIYLTKPWKAQSGGDDSVWDTMAGWVDNVAAARSSFTFAGDDERAWFEPNAATYSSDSIHYNTAGQTAAAAAKKTALGY